MSTPPKCVCLSISHACTFKMHGSEKQHCFIALQECVIPPRLHYRLQHVTLWHEYSRIKSIVDHVEGQKSGNKVNRLFMMQIFVRGGWRESIGWLCVWKSYVDSMYCLICLCLSFLLPLILCFHPKGKHQNHNISDAYRGRKEGENILMYSHQKPLTLITCWRNPSVCVILR